MGATLAILGAAGPVGAALRAPGGNLIVTFWDRPDTAQAGQRLVGIGPVRELVPEAGVWSVTPVVPLDRARAQTLARWKVRAAEWSLRRQTDERVNPSPAPQPPAVLIAPAQPFTDPLFAPEFQWGLFPPATTWTPTLTGTATRPRIAILDSGIDRTQEEWSATPSVLVDPKSTFASASDASDWGRTGHGTHVAGIAAAPANDVGIVGVAPAQAGTAEVIPVQIADRNGQSTDETMMAGIRWAVARNARVINISAGGPGYSQAFQNTVNWAFRRALIVSSVGNEGQSGNDLNYPAAYDHVVGVGAQCDGEVALPDCPVAFGQATFSNRNRSVDLIAPGVNVLSSVPVRVTERSERPGYAYKDGTSMAAPFVAGVAALVFGANPDATPEQVLRQLESTATDIGPRGRDDRSGFGVVNPQAALTATLPPAELGEPNDDVRDLVDVASLQERRFPAVIDAAFDQFDDPEDVYPVQLRKGERVLIGVTPASGIIGLYIWAPGTRSVAPESPAYRASNLITGANRRAPGRKRLIFRAPSTGRFLVNVTGIAGRGTYRLTISRVGAR